MDVSQSFDNGEDDDRVNHSGGGGTHKSKGIDKSGVFYWVLHDDTI